eukprot:CAMPEP_0197320748 /NCGR_PEP_ID=MMETSP0891-20130614/61421_1 /TAXON_ID=44058 ORGANISM="Aureoumbra lagunensis, Strain CCMP1510" /NCGR_SAMPLE_ID=MMETSP0891 /ASSEMBLY_ACC=CAM_ASM_000534 /LENGTH=558 /DNA_ID=CAMNT_0042812281 /DNA_START=195 /DNA_END=1871 /DNA_ORIENTATION=-
MTRLSSSFSFVDEEENIKEISTEKIRSGWSQPDIIHIVLDDVGMNDAIIDSTDLPIETVAPTIKKLRQGGVVLGAYYGQSFCTPARATLLTGKFTHRIGFSGNDIAGSTDLEISAWSNFTLAGKNIYLPKYMKRYGYQTYGVGKWNLGHCNTKMLPTSRGFDTFFGYLGAGISYTSHAVEGTPSSPSTFTFDGVDYELYDMVDCNATSTSEKDMCTTAGASLGTYSTTLFTTRAKLHIEEASITKPIYLFLAYHGVHDDDDVNATASDLSSSILKTIQAAIPSSNPMRRNFAYGLRAIDDGIATLWETIEKYRTADFNYVIVIHGDNGGSACGSYCIGSNTPLRGQKFYDFDGGVKVPGIIYSNALLPSSVINTTYSGLMHHVDWLATFVNGLARGYSQKSTISDCSDCDSRNQWGALSGETDSGLYDIRDTIAFSITSEYASIRLRNYKLLHQRANETWYTPDQFSYETSSCFNSGTENFLFDLEMDPDERTNLFYDDDYFDIKLKLVKEWKKRAMYEYVERDYPPGYSYYDREVSRTFYDSTDDAHKFVVPWGCSA